MARVGNRNPKEHFMIVTVTFGYVIVVVVESIGQTVVLFEEFWSLCKANRTEPPSRRHPFEICCCGSHLWTMTQNTEPMRKDIRDNDAGEELEQDS